MMRYEVKSFILMVINFDRKREHLGGTMIEVIPTTVFADGPNGGNPCPVILGADNYSDEEMRALAEELSAEVGFILATNRPACDYQFRFFVPNKEMTMCGHATIACATVLYDRSQRPIKSLTIETLAGDIPIEFLPMEEGIQVSVAQKAGHFESINVSKETIAQALNISCQQIVSETIYNASTSKPKTLIALDSRETLDNLRPQLFKLWDICDMVDSSGFYPYVQVADDVFFARQFPNNSGYDEDAATGVAASALGAFVAHNLNNEIPLLTVYQGQAMERPSKIQVKDAGKMNAIVGHANILVTD